MQVTADTTCGQFFLKWQPINRYDPKLLNTAGLLRTIYPEKELRWNRTISSRQRDSVLGAELTLESWHLAQTATFTKRIGCASGDK